MFTQTYQYFNHRDGNMTNLKGSNVKSSLWPKPVEIKDCEETGDYVNICCNSSNSLLPIDQLSELDKLEYMNNLLSSTILSVFYSL